MMGCAHGKEISTSNRNQDERIQSSVFSGKQSQVSAIKKKDNKKDVENSDDKEQRKESSLRPTANNESKPDPRRSNPPKNLHGEQVAAGWPSWLSSVAGEALHGWTPRRADSFKKISKIGQGTYSNVYKAMDCETGKIVALKKVRFDHSEIESLKFMAREILILRRLDHPNIVKLNGLATSRLSSSLYLVFDYMEHDLAGLAASPGIKFTEPQVKCYMQQLLSGLEHCHKHGVLHRDIKGSNLLLDNTGTLKIADFGLALFYDPNCRHRMTSRVVTLWYRAPELLMGATEYGDGIDLWSAGCILAELLAGRPIMPGRTEVEQLHKIFKLCGSPSDEYWKKSKLPHATVCKPKEPYKRCIVETFKDFPPSALSLIENLLTIDPSERPTSSEALKSEFFRTEPYACDPASLPVYPPSKEIDARLRDEEQRRLRAAHGKTETGKKSRVRDRPVPARAIAALDVNAELQANLDRRRLINRANATCKSEKFPPPHQDGSIGYPLGSSQRMDHSFYDDSSTIFMNQNDSLPSFSGSLLAPNKFANRNPEKIKKSFGYPQKKNHIQA